MNKLGIFLDDERNPEDVTWITYPNDIEWIVVRDVKDFMDLIKDLLDNGDTPDYISFDNDLGHDRLRGIDAAKQLCDLYNELNLALPTCFIHSQNNVASDYIESMLESYSKIQKERIQTKLSTDFA